MLEEIEKVMEDVDVEWNGGVSHLRIVCIVGESTVGKTTIARRLTENPKYNLIKSYTTRPPRPEEENGESDHIFIDKEEAARKMRFNPYVASTIINNEVYFALESQFQPDKINVYVVDDLGLMDVLNHRWWDSRYAFIFHFDLLPVRIKRNTPNSERKTRFGEFIPDDFIDVVIENNGDVDEVVSEIDKRVDLKWDDYICNIQM